MARPLISLVVIVFDMREQALRTLRSLSVPYQRGVSADEYEILVVENASPRVLDPDEVCRVAPNARYFLREESSPSPAGAVNFGVSEARADRVGILVDGARLLTPGVVRLAILSGRLAEPAVLSVPGYHLGSQIQQRAVESGYDERMEAELLAGIQWPDDGYRLFDVACFSGSCAGGFLRPYSESNCLCLPKTLFESLGGFNVSFQSSGGGYVNLDFYSRVLEVESATLFVTPGEGTFHQFHGGATTGGRVGAARERLMDELAAEYARVRGKPYALPTRTGLLLGEVAAPAHRFLADSLARAAK